MFVRVTNPPRSYYGLYGCDTTGHYNPWALKAVSTTDWPGPSCGLTYNLVSDCCNLLPESSSVPAWDDRPL